MFHLSAGLKVGDRTESQTDWTADKVPVIVATISFGMGVDKANVRSVTHCKYTLQLKN